MNIIITSLLSVFLSIAPEKNKPLPEIEPGDHAPKADIPMKDVVSGSQHSLKDLVGEKGLVVIFTSNTCPYVIAWEEAYPDISGMANEMNMASVLINSNEAFRGDQDTPDAMRKKAEEGNYNMPYLIDDSHVLADAFGAKTTPHVFLFDADLVLVYKGAIDDRYDGGKKEAPETYWLREAMTLLHEGVAIERSSTRQIGCSIKRIKK